MALLPYFWWCIGILISLWPLIVSYNYCGPGREWELCPLTKGEVHFMCNKSATVPPDGALLGLYPMTKKLKKYLLYMHNFHRNSLASGDEKFGADDTCCFPKASRMRELIWDDELEYIAKEHAKQCYMEHDHCHNTDRFPYAGQNLGFWAGKKNNTAKYIIDMSFRLWYIERKYIADGNVLPDQYVSAVITAAKAGHFTQLVNDQVSRVGCAITVCTNCSNSKNKDNPHRRCYFLTCNYDSTNINKLFIYKTDPHEAATNCSAWGVGRSKNFTNLCANSGRVFPLQKT